MRTIVEIPTGLIEFLTKYCEMEKVSRAEAIRRSIKLLEEKKESQNEKDDNFFGMWKKKKIKDSVKYVDKMRSEWDR